MLYLSKADNNPDGQSAIRELLSHDRDRPRIGLLQVPKLSMICLESMVEYHISGDQYTQ